MPLLKPMFALLSAAVEGRRTYSLGAVFVKLVYFCIAQTYVEY